MTLTEKPHEVDTADELDAFLASHEVALVDFYTKGCALCQAIEPVVGNVARATTATVATCNPQTDLSLVDEYDIRSVPTLLLFEDGSDASASAEGGEAAGREPVARMAEGFQGTEAVVDFVVENSSAERVTHDATEAE